MSKKISVTIAISALVVGLLLGLWVESSKQCDGFFALKLSDLLNAASQLLSASIIAFLVYKLQSKSSRVRDIKVKAFDNYLDKLDSIHKSMDDFIGNPTPALRQLILRTFKLANNDLSLIQEVNNKSRINGFDLNVFQTFHNEYKKAVTGGTFASQSPSISWAEQIKINETYNSIIKAITFLRIENGN